MFVADEILRIYIFHELLIIDIILPSHSGCAVDSASNGNEYQEYFVGGAVRTPVCLARSTVTADYRGSLFFCNDYIFFFIC